jgi:hypothetical protein
LKVISIYYSKKIISKEFDFQNKPIKVFELGIVADKDAADLLPEKGYRDYNHGSLQTVGDALPKASAEWTKDNSVCTYRLKQFQQIHAGQTFYVKFTIRNPQEAMPKTHNENQWKIKLRGRGFSEVERDMATYNFISLTNERNLNAE